ncbi:hypothetical protein ACFSTD_21135 [Novosphingobium colocasiae]
MVAGNQRFMTWPLARGAFERLSDREVKQGRIDGADQLAQGWIVHCGT